MWNHFRIVPFIIGVVLGLFVVFAYKTPMTTVYEYPHPQNVKHRVYRDKNGVCYKYEATEVSCDENEATLKPYPLQA